jgi:hypothetical protein
MNLLLAILILAQSTNPIDIEMVRKDLLVGNHIIPDDFIKKAKPAAFNVMYSDELCFVHLPYQATYGGPAMQSSDVMVYRLKEGKWTLDNHTSGWSDLKLMDPDQLIFFANVRHCIAGKCDMYAAVSHYEGGNFFVYREYKGFDNSGHKSVTKDTVIRSLIPKDFNIQQHQTSFTVVRTIAVGAKKPVESYERVIINY